MKKIFTLLAVVLVALSANAQKITFGEGDIASAGTLNGKTYTNEGMVLTVTDGEGKFSVDANNAWFGDASAQVQFTHRLKTGGKSQTTSGKERWLTLTLPTSGTLRISARSASSSETGRNIVIVQNGTTLLDQIVKDEDHISVEIAENINPETNPTGATKVYPIYEVAVAAGEAEINFPNGSVNFYCFELIPGEGPGPGPGPDDPTVASQINFPTSTDGITIGGTTTWNNTQKYHANKDEVSNISFANGYTTSEVINDNFALLLVDGGFLKGDVVTVAGYFNNSEESKQAAVSLFIGEKGEAPTVLWKSDLFINGKTVADDPTPQSYTLEDNYVNLKLGRADGLTGATRTNVTLLTVTRNTTGIEEVLPVRVVMDGAIYNLQGQRVDANYRGVVIMNGKKMIQK